MTYTQNNISLTEEGRLQIAVFEDSVGMPAPNATVRVSLHSENGNAGDAEILDELVTDASGQTLEVVLPAPPVENSLAPDGPTPFASYDLAVTLPEHPSFYVRGVQIFPNTLAYQNAFLQPGEGESQVINIDPPSLYANFPPKTPEEEIKPLPPNMGHVVLPDPVVPEYIIVHDGAPSNSSAPNYWIPFKDYIKNVACCEIYSTWPSATIRANVLAILSFTLNRVYTEWYRSKGYDFTITSSTAYDHAFSYGRNFFQEISIIVDEIFTTFITRPGIRQPLLAQYCDGQRTQCPNWMTQWGSKRLGDQGYDTVSILRHYYGGDIFLMQANKVSGVPSSFPGTNLQVGSTGHNVRIIQEQLNAISNNFPAINKIRVDGLFGEQTRTAVETFQSVFKIPMTGIVNFSTWYRISNIYVAVTRMAEL